MKALLVKQPGPDGVLEPAILPGPVPAAGQVIVRVGAVGANFSETLVRQGFFGAGPRIPGLDIAGTIVELGRGVTGFVVGERVIVNPAITCGQCGYCRAGNHGTCRQRSALGQGRDGGYAEFVAVPAENLHYLSDDIPFSMAATIPSPFFTAWQMLFARARLKPGETVLVTGAAGGVGSAAVQSAKLAGARVIAVAGGEAKHLFLRDWGADVVIDYSQGDSREAIADLTAGAGVDVALDIVGASNWPLCIGALKAGGRLVTCSINGGRNPDLDILDLMTKQLSVMGAGAAGPSRWRATSSHWSMPASSMAISIGSCRWTMRQRRCRCCWNDGSSARSS